MNHLLQLYLSPSFTGTRHFIKVTKSLPLNFIMPRHPKELQQFERPEKGYLQLRSHPTVNHDCTHEWNTTLCHHKRRQWGTDGMSPTFFATSRLRDLQMDNEKHAKSHRGQPGVSFGPISSTSADSLLIQASLWVTTCGAEPWVPSYLCQYRGESRNIMVTFHKANYRCGCLLDFVVRATWYMDFMMSAWTFSISGHLVSGSGWLSISCNELSRIGVLSSHSQRLRCL